jgi:hypothetical protein
MPSTTSGSSLADFLGPALRREGAVLLSWAGREALELARGLAAELAQITGLGGSPKRGAKASSVRQVRTVRTVTSRTAGQRGGASVSTTTVTTVTTTASRHAAPAAARR